MPETYLGKTVNGNPFDSAGAVVVSVLDGTSGTSGNNGTSGTSGGSGTGGALVSVVELGTWAIDRQYSLSTGLATGTILGIQLMLKCTTANNNYEVNDTVTAPTPQLFDAGGLPRQGIGVQFKSSVPDTIRILTNVNVTIMSAWTADGGTTDSFSITNTAQWAILAIITHT